MTSKITIAIDGYSSTGKSTMARQMAYQLRYNYVDTGAMYRAVTLYALQNDLFHPALDVQSLVEKLPDIELHFDKSSSGKGSDMFLNGKNVEKQIRGMEVSNKVSEVAAVSEVRHKLVAEQKKMGARGGVVMDGRDIGTVVFPDAELKIFMTARDQVRVQRRLDELRHKGMEVTRQEVEANLRQRDLQDSTREDSPLTRADDARILDNSEMSAEEQLKLALGWAEEIIQNL
ncbi:MAG TPA: (d)CMP kinase [Cryomorphaceae bacterium]|nr:cytidylate kinase [Owenweeksia sp.]MBG00521.1 cytidylate kinase [Owenweeksia sp.]HAD98732.1 (d)CMP kinase [Cryomorphaceae bacterium]HBF19984.1 (d)CMP kinase [Cryomorphaceae bacterium]HCQ15901.1 (d)CMP kinase [Cryomorphaceae bacterium]|tara:strand:- start:402 stop:1094 length:693 start_codon:yes stop_codon:yes gene_type:complete